MKQNLRLLLTLLLLLALGSENSFAAYSETTFKSDFSDGDYVVFADYTGDDAVVPDWMKHTTIIYKQNFKIRKRLLKNRYQASFNIFLSIIYRNSYCNSVLHLSSTYI